MSEQHENNNGLNYLKMQEQAIAEECQKQTSSLSAITAHLPSGWEAQILDKLNFLITANRGRDALRKVIHSIQSSPEDKQPEPRIFNFQISSLFLRECHDYLISDKRNREMAHLVTGTITSDQTRVLSKIEKLSYDKQSPAYVSGDLNNTTQRIIKLSANYEHLVLGVFHSHISNGPQSTYPSPTDISCMKRLAWLGIHCLSGIFSLDGYVRFFMTQKKYRIEIYGKGASLFKDEGLHKIFKIED